MRRLPTKLRDLILFEGTPHFDDRGFFTETWRKNSLDIEFVQENHSRSIQGTLRGIHFQPGQAKLVRCASGRILDVAVDLRSASATYLKWEAFELSDINFRQLLIPDGFGHGFYVLSDSADVTYKLTSYYDPKTEADIRWDDPRIGIDWPQGNRIISDRDRKAPELSDIEPLNKGW